MEELLALLKEENIELNLLDVPVYYHDGEEGKEFIHRLKGFLSNLNKI